MAMSEQARAYRNRKRRERYANDPAFREKEIKRVEAYWERKAAEAALEDQQRQQSDDEAEGATI